MSEQEFNPENVQIYHRPGSRLEYVDSGDYDRLLALFRDLKATHEAELRRTVTALQAKQIAQLERLAEENVAEPAATRDRMKMMRAE